jgi:hypothetical protein
MPTDTYTAWRTKFSPATGIDLLALQADLDDMEARITAAEAELDEKRAALDELRADRDALSGFRNFLVHGRSGVAHVSGGGHVSAEGRRTPSKRKNKRDAIAGMLDGGALHASAIRKLLVEAGEIEPGEKAYHSLQVTLSQMYRDEILDRVDRGVYRLASNADALVPAEAPC